MAEEGDDASDTSEESEIEEELGFFSLIDAINPYTTFKHALTSAWLPTFLFGGGGVAHCSDSFSKQECATISSCDDYVVRGTTDVAHGSHDPR